MKNRINFLGYPVDICTEKETLLTLQECIVQHRQVIREDLNAAKVVWMHKDPAYAQMIQNADIINADGMSVVWAVKFLLKQKISRITGIDLMEKLIALSHESGYTVFFLGAQKDIVQKTVAHYETLYSKQIVAGYHDGYFTDEDNIVKMINQSHADILLIGMNSPRKENFVSAHKDQLKTSLVMGVGGSFDVIAGKVKRAPLWMQNAGLEWFYRFLQEPGRMWKRYIYTNSYFLFLVFKEKIKQLYPNTAGHKGT
ncbi:WecB/TagA/CpsF family glycosyltransferase [Sulfurovum sp.]|uniref:WecB/TagA/CpsF family glycosyltransferase n=1 Tax=Sulfurovum sp. TaxID=1969726 RepID=UPI0025FB0209|nr:WecB/TagA/CpsF family glycosyltransferase [Sulfurovum sp.]